MLLWQPAPRQIKELELACIKVWPDQTKLIERAALVLESEPFLVRQPHIGTNPLAWYCASQANSGKYYQLTMAWDPAHEVHCIRDGRNFVACECHSCRHGKIRLRGCEGTVCKHTLAWYMYRRLVEDQAAALDYPSPPGVTWFDLSNGKRGVNEEGLAHLAVYLAVMRFHPAEFPEPIQEWQPALPKERMAYWWKTGSIHE